MKKIFNKKMATIIAAATVIAFPLTSYAANKLVVKDNTDVEKFVVTDTGKVGIGTTNPPSTLSVVETASPTTRGLAVYQYTTSAAAPIGQFFKSRGTEIAPVGIANGDYTGSFAFRNYTGTQWLGNAFFGARVNGTPTSTSVPTDLFFCTSDTGVANCFTENKVRLIVTSNGNVGFGVNTPVYPIETSTGAYLSSGGVWTDASSRALKENINELDIFEAKDALQKLNPVIFNYKADTGETHLGFIAEDVPDVVATKDRNGLSPMDIVAVLTKVVQDQTKAIADLEQKIKFLENRGE